MQKIKEGHQDHIFLGLILGVEALEYSKIQKCVYVYIHAYYFHYLNFIH